ncbi:MAG: hypothetical protein JOZ96_27480 [Acidobacteria bacterium]|nr:hypothetical protein [Acidobacteriota bacterium]
MPLSRRSFLRTGTTAVLATAAALHVAPKTFAQVGAKPDPKQDFKTPFAAQQSTLFSFKRETFTPYVGGIFIVSAGSRAVEMTLVEVRGHVVSASGKKLTKKLRETDSFALVFSSASELSDLTTIYNVEHAALGRFALFLTRRDNPQGGYVYEAVFNHAL